MPFHPHAQPNFRNMVIHPMWMTLKAALRTIPYLGSHKWLAGHRTSPSYHAQETLMIDEETAKRVGKDHHSVGKIYAADRESSSVVPYLERPVTVMYPYERLEDLEPWLFVPGNYNGRIGVIWETCTGCKACVRACPNGCLHMTSEKRVNVLELAEDGDEWHGYGEELEVGGFAARRNDIDNTEHDIFNAHDAVAQEYDFGSIIDISGDSATVRWDGGEMEEVTTSDLIPAEQDIVSGRIDMGRCMFCGLCMEACPFESFFMTNEYDGMTGYDRTELWFDADRTRVLPALHQERVDAELAKRAEKEQRKRAKKAEKAAKAAKAEA